MHLLTRFNQYLMLLTLLLSACDSNTPKLAPLEVAQSASKAKESDIVSVMGDAVNYMHKHDVKYTLYDLSQTPPMAIGGSIVDPLSAGGGKGCCITLPKKWHPGMKVRVEWGMSDRKGKYEQPSQDLEIPPYDVAADLYVVFYGKEDIELVVSPAEPGHPEWRGREKQTPWDACVAKNGRKPCFMALPKLFNTGSAQGFCTWLERKNDPEAEELCGSSMFQCMKDYEDQAFCDGILWGKEPTCEEEMSKEYCEENAEEWEAMR